MITFRLVERAFATGLLLRRRSLLRLRPAERRTVGRSGRLRIRSRAGLAHAAQRYDVGAQRMSLAMPSSKPLTKPDSRFS